MIGGERLVIAGNADGYVYALKSRTGEKVWSFHASLRGLNAAPVVDDYRVYVAHSEENLDSTLMGRVVCLDGRGHGDITKTGEIWRTRRHRRRLRLAAAARRTTLRDDEQGRPLIASMP